MSGVTQTEMALAFITAGTLLFIARYWKQLLALYLIIVFFKSRKDNDE